MRWKASVCAAHLATHFVTRGEAVQRCAVSFLPGFLGRPEAWERKNWKTGEESWGRGVWMDIRG